MTRHPRALLAIGVTLALVACDGNDDTDGTTTTTAGTIAPTSTSTSTPEPTTPAETTPSTATTATTAVASTDPATTDTPPVTETPTTPPISEQDWAAILETLSACRVELYATPDLSRISEYCLAGSQCAEDLETQLGDAIARGVHVEGQHPFTVVEVVSAAIGEPTDVGTTAVVTVVVAPTTLPPARLIDAAGNLVNELTPTTTKTKGQFVLLSSDDPELPWRVAAIEDLGAVP